MDFRSITSIGGIISFGITNKENRGFSILSKYGLACTLDDDRLIDLLQLDGSEFNYKYKNELYKCHKEYINNKLYAYFVKYDFYDADVTERIGYFGACLVFISDNLFPKPENILKILNSAIDISKEKIENNKSIDLPFEITNSDTMPESKELKDLKSKKLLAFNSTTNLQEQALLFISFSLVNNYIDLWYTANIHFVKNIDKHTVFFDFKDYNTIINNSIIEFNNIDLTKEDILIRQNYTLKQEVDEIASSLNQLNSLIKENFSFQNQQNSFIKEDLKKLKSHTDINIGDIKQFHQPLTNSIDTIHKNIKIIFDSLKEKQNPNYKAFENTINSFKKEQQAFSKNLENKISKINTSSKNENIDKTLLNIFVFGTVAIIILFWIFTSNQNGTIQETINQNSKTIENLTQQIEYKNKMINSAFKTNKLGYLKVLGNGNVNIRYSPNGKSDKITTLSSGSKCKILHEGNYDVVDIGGVKRMDWYLIEYSNVVGWISGHYIEKIDIY